MASSQPSEPIRRDNTGGSANSQLASRNPYRDSTDATTPRHEWATPLQSPHPQQAYSNENPELPPRPEERADSPHPGFTAPSFAAYEEQQSRGFVSDEELGPPRRRLTTGDIPLVSVGYTRNPERVIAYLIELPAPLRQGQRMDVPHVCGLLPENEIWSFVG